MHLPRLYGRRSPRMRMEKFGGTSRVRTLCVVVSASVAFWWVLFVFHFYDGRDSTPASDAQQVNFPFLFRGGESLRISVSSDPHKLSLKDPASEVPVPTGDLTASNSQCAGRFVFVHRLPAEYNIKIMEDCAKLNLWEDMCLTLGNHGFGQPLDDSDGVFSAHGWYATNQFALEIIFHERIKRYNCLTSDSSKANAVFVPFYAGLEIMQHLWDPVNVSMAANITVRDAASLSIMEWLVSRPEWKRFRGMDHFLVGGRITWDFRRQTDEMWDWGNKLLILPAAKNITTLVIEASPWHSNDFAIPYPTYFHPSKDSEVQEWQQKVISLERKSLFCFAGAPRPEIPDSIRGTIISQCANSKHCQLLACGKSQGKCHSPTAVSQLFQESIFCLQPQGDSFTRRSIFDSMLAGCIPVLFHVYSAYSQYIWHFPTNYAEYSVYIPEDDIKFKNASIEDVLLRIPPKHIEKMREAVISLIPKIIYRDPTEPLQTKDAFDLTMDALFDKFSKLIPENPVDTSLAMREVGQRELGHQYSSGKHEWKR